MERLTERYGDGYIAIKGCSTAYKGKERKGAPASNAIVRLAAYEDTGLDPVEVSEYKHLCDSYVEAGLDSKFVQFCIDATQNGLSIDRICELAQAEKDGRLVVLQGGVTVHYLQEEYRKAKCMADKRLPSPDYTTGSISGFGAGAIYILDKILTQEEAEAALKKREAADNEAD